MKSILLTPLMAGVCLGALAVEIAPRDVSFELWEVSAPKPGGGRTLVQLDWGADGKFLGGVGKYGSAYGVRTPKPLAVTPRGRCEVTFEGRAAALSDTFILYAEVYDASGRKICSTTPPPPCWNYSPTTDTFFILGISLASTGTWEKVTKPFAIPDGVATLRLSVCPWRGAGVWCRSLAITERNGLNRRLALSGDLARSDVEKGGLALSVKAKPDAKGGLAIAATVKDVATPPRPRALELKLIVKKPLSGWTWHRDGRRDEHLADASVRYDNQHVGGHPVSRYPFTAVSKGGDGFVLAMPLGEPAYESRAVSTNGVTSSVALGLLKRKAGGTEATFRWQLFPFKGAWGFRSAARAYYVHQGGIPKPKPGSKEGTWLWPIWPSRGPANPADFGLVFWEAPSTILRRPDEVAAAHARGIEVFPYTEAWGMRQTLKAGPNGELPPLAERFAELKGWAAEGKTGKTWFDVPRHLAAQAALNSLPVQPDGTHPFVVDKYDSWAQWWRTNADPRLAKPNRASICWDATFSDGKIDLADGVYLDSVAYGFAEDFRNVRADHLAVMDEPLVYDVETAVPCADGMQHQVAFVKGLAKILHAKGKRVFGNVFGISHRFNAALIDVYGSEVGGWGNPGGETRFHNVASDVEAGEKRFYAGQRPVTDLLQEGRYSSPVKEFSARAMTNYVARELFYGFYPGVSTIGGEEKAGYANWKRYFGKERQCERDRALFRAVVPLIRRLNEAGWQPEPLVRSSAACVWTERFGEPKDGAWFITVRNCSDRATTATLTPEGLEARAVPVWQGSPAPLAVVGGGGFTLTLAPWQTAVYRMEPAPKEPLSSAAAWPKCDLFGPGEFFVGCNHWGSKDGIHMWRAQDWSAEETAKDLRALAANGVEVMRVFPTWSEFQPVVEYLNWAGQHGGYVTEGAERPLASVAGLDPMAMERFRFFCDEAKRNNIRLIVSLVTGWMSGRLFYPRALEGRNLITDPEALMWEGRFARAFVREMRGHPAIAAWDLGNECNCLGKVENAAQAWNWLNTISSAVRMEDPARPVISGMHGISSSAKDPWNMQMQGELLDILTPHPYPAPWRVDANRGPFNGFRNALHQVGQCLFYEGAGGKRAFPQEVGNFGPTVSPDRLAAVGFRQEMFASWMHGLAGFLLWCSFEQMHLDYPPYTDNAMERELGLLKADSARTPKPTAVALKAFKHFKDALPFKALPPRRVDAVCLLSERTDFWQTSYGAFLLAKQAGFDLTFAGAESCALPEAKLYFVPSGEAWDVYTHRAWKRVLAKAEAGATVVVSRGGSAGYSSWLEATGLEQQLWRTPRSVDFEMDGVKLHATDTFTAIQTPIACDVRVRDRSGNVVVSVKRYGRGKVIAVNFKLEQLAMTQLANVFEGNFSNELWRIYDLAAKEAGVTRLVTRKDRQVVFTEHPRPDGSTLVCALNTRPEAVACEIKVAKGKVGRVWNGAFRSGRLEIRANDGCIFEVRPD